MSDNEGRAILQTLSMATPFDVFLALGPTTKLCAFVALLCGVVALLLAAIRLMSGGKRSGALSVAGLIGLIFGVLGAAFTGMTSLTAYLALRPTHFLVVLPSIIEATYVLVLGLLVWLISRIGNAGAAKAN